MKLESSLHCAHAIHKAVAADVIFQCEQAAACGAYGKNTIAAGQAFAGITGRVVWRGSTINWSVQQHQLGGSS